MRRLRLALTLALLGAGCRNFEVPPPRLTVSPLQLAFTAPTDTVAPPPQPLFADLQGGGPLDWSAVTDAPWLRITPAQGSAPAVCWVTALPTGLSVGSYSGRITLTAVIDTLTVAVRFDVTAAPTLTGRWAFIADTINVGLVLADASGTVTGTGNFNAPDARRRFFSVHGTAQSPAVRLTLTETDSTRVSFTGSLVNDNVLDGVLDGGSFTGARVVLIRQ